MTSLQVFQLLAGPPWLKERAEILDMSLPYIAQVLCCPRDERGFPKWPPDPTGCISLAETVRKHLFHQGWPAHLISGEIQRRLAEAQEQGDPNATADPAAAAQFGTAWPG